MLEVKCCPMKKDQGVGPVVNNLFYLSVDITWSSRSDKIKKGVMMYNFEVEFCCTF